MGLYDIFDEIAERQVLKTETGDSRIIGVVSGIVVNNYDKDMPGRVCVTVPIRDKEANELKWARVTMPSSGSKWGCYFLPETGDQVLLAFEHGNIESPYVIGCVPKDTNKFLTAAKDENNQYKKIITKNGNRIEFEDNKEGEGDKDKISISTGKEKHRITMDNENDKIILSDKENKNQLELCTRAGEINIRAEKKLTIVIGNNDIKISMNGESGTVGITCKRFKVECDDQANIQCSGRMKLEGSEVSCEGTTSLKIASDGITSLSGKVIKMG